MNLSLVEGVGLPVDSVLFGVEPDVLASGGDGQAPAVGGGSVEGVPPVVGVLYLLPQVAIAELPDWEHRRTRLDVHAGP